MLNFSSDYVEGAHPQILKALSDTNMEQLPGYGSDLYCLRAQDKIRAACAAPNASVYFLVGGTQTNAVVIDAIMDPHEGVIAVDTSHINVESFYKAAN